MNNQASILNLESEIFDDVIDSSELYTDNYDENGNLAFLNKDDNNDGVVDSVETSEDQLLVGDDLNDEINGSNGVDNIQGKGGDDTIGGGRNNDFLSGGAGNDKIRGGDGNDNIHGNGGNDTLNGGQQFDQLFGGAGDDVLIGNDGTDILEGGEGNDLFYLQGNVSGTDWVQDFDINADRIGLADGLSTDNIEITGNVNSFISFNGDRIAVLLNVNPNELTDKNFQEF